VLRVVEVVVLVFVVESGASANSFHCCNTNGIQATQKRSDNSESTSDSSKSVKTLLASSTKPSLRLRGTTISGSDCMKPARHGTADLFKQSPFCARRQLDSQTCSALSRAPAVPRGWTIHLSTTIRVIYYMRSVDGHCQWAHPTTGFAFNAACRCKACFNQRAAAAAL
jgi:hypothetical protein